MKTNMDMHMTSAIAPGERIMMTRLRTLGLGLLLMVVPALGLASALSDLAAKVKPGAFLELEIDGPVSTCQAMIPPLPLKNPETGEDIYQRSYLGNILEFTDEALWDPTGQDVYIMGTRRPYKRWDQGFVKYSEKTNSWEILDLPPFGVGAHGYDNGALDTQRREYYWSRIGAARNVWKMDLDAGTWKELPDAPIEAGQFSAIEFFPELDRLVFFDGLRVSEYALYNPESGQWEEPTALTVAPFGGISHFSEYNPSYGVMLFGGGYNYSAGGTIPDPTPGINESRRLYMLDSDRVVTRLADAPTKLGQHSVGPMQTIDPNSGNLVVFQGELNDGSCPRGPLPIWEYDLQKEEWNQTGEHKMSDLWCRMNSVVVPLYEYGVNFIVSVKNDNDCRVHLYRHNPAGDVPLNISVPPAAVTVQQGEVATFRVMAVGNGQLSYQWRKNRVNIDDATTANYSFTALDMADNNAEFDVVVSNATETVTSTAAALTITVDTLAPTLQSVFAVNNVLVDIVFSEAVSIVGAENSANYQIDLGIAVTSATLSEDGRTVSLAVNQLTEDTTYTVLVSNVQDLAQTPNTITTLSKSFTYRTADNFEDNNAIGWTPLTAANWDVVTDAGDMAYYLKGSSNPGNGRLGEYSLLPGAYSDFTLTAQARLGADVASNPSADYAIVFGFQNADNYYYALFNNNQDYTQLFKVINGSRIALDTATTDWLNDDLYHSIEVKRTGSAISVRFDGNVILNANDGSLGAGKVGVGSYNDSAYFDDVSVTGAVSSGGSTGGGSTGGGSTGGGSTGGGSTGGGSTGGGSTGGGSTGGGSTGGGSTGGSSSGGGAAGDDEAGGGALSLFSGLALLLISAGRLRRRVRLCRQHSLDTDVV